MAKKLLKGFVALEQMKIGIDEVADSASISIGPRGGNVAFRDAFNQVRVSNDGKDIADSVELDDPVQQMGVEVAQKVANRTNDESGDARSTALLLLKSITTEGMKYIPTGISTPHLRVGIEKATAQAIDYLRDISVKVESNEDIEKVASISSKDPQIGKIVAELVEKVGKDGIITTEESNKIGIESDVVEGIEFERGYISPYMINDTDRMEAEYKNVPVLITDKSISSFDEITPIMKKVAAKSQAMILICDDLKDVALGGVLLNKIRGGLAILAVRAPGHAEQKAEWLADIATLCGTRVITKEMEKPLPELELTDLGVIGRIISNSSKTVIMGDGNNKDDIDEKVRQLKAERESKNKYQQELIDQRIARLAGGVGVIKVGTLSETDTKYLRAKVSDAVASAKGAIEFGILPGGGIALMKVSMMLENFVKENTDMRMETKLGYEILAKALMASIKQIIANSGEEESSSIISEIKKLGGNAGFNADTNEVVKDMIEAGVADAFRSMKCAVEFAASESAIFLTTKRAHGTVKELNK